MADAVVGFKVKNLAESVKMMQKVSPGVRKEVTALVREETILIKNMAFARSRSAPGVSRNGYPFGKGAYTRRATASKGSVGINRGGAGKNALVFGAEFGAHVGQRLNWPNQKHQFIAQNRMQRRTLPVWRGNATTIRGSHGPGWIILPILRKEVPKIGPRLEDGINKVFLKAARSSGVKKALI